MTRAAIIAAIALAAGWPQTSPPPGITRTVVVDNATALVARLRYEAGKGETSHTHPFSAVVIQLTPGEVEMTLAGDRSRARREAGSVWFIPANTPHMAVNTGTAPCEQIAVTIKPTRAAAPAAPPTERAARASPAPRSSTTTTRAWFGCCSRRAAASRCTRIPTIC